MKKFIAITIVVLATIGLQLSAMAAEKNTFSPDLEPDDTFGGLGTTTIKPDSNHGFGQRYPLETQLQKLEPASGKSFGRGTTQR